MDHLQIIDSIEAGLRWRVENGDFCARSVELGWPRSPTERSARNERFEEPWGTSTAPWCTDEDSSAKSTLISKRSGKLSVPANRRDKIVESVELDNIEQK